MWSVADLDAAEGTRTEQVVGLIVSMIERGELAVASRLPSERRLAASLGVSRVTVVRALESLRADGVVETVHGSGTRVRPSDRLIDPVATAATVQSGSGAGPVIDLRFATTAAPQEVADAFARVGPGLVAAMAGDGPPPGGSGELRALLAAMLTADGSPTDPDHVTATTGAASALEAVVAGLALGPGAVITETPTYPAALEIFRRHRLEVIGWPAGPAAWEVEQLRQLTRRRPVLVYLQSDNHNPTGASLPADRRAAVIDVARRSGATVISDETLRPLWLSSERQPERLGSHPGVISIGSLSKTVWGGLRIGWIRSSRTIRRRLVQSAPRGLIAPGAMDELLAVELADRLTMIIERRCGLLRANLAGLESGLASWPGVGWTTPTGGMTVWLELRSARPRTVVAAAREAGVLISNGEAFGVDRRPGRHVRLSFTPAAATLRRAAALLGPVLGA